MGSLFLVMCVGSTVIDALIAVLVVFRLTRGGTTRVFGAPLLGAIVAAGSAFAIKLAPFWALGLGLFGVIHLAYLDLVVLPSVLVLAGFWLERRRRAAWASKPLAGLAAGLVACVGPAIGAYASFVEPFALRLESTQITVPATHRPAENLRIGVLADIQTAHVTDYEHRAVDMLMAQRPDLILLPGDLFHGADATFASELEGLRHLIRRLQAPGGVYFALGDADTREELAAICEGTSIRVLVNEAHRIEIKGRTVTVAGVELDSARAGAMVFLRDFEAAPGDDLRLLLSHKPDAVLRLRQPTRVDLVVAGHTHGGQVQLPWLGPLLILSGVPRFVGAGGYHLLDGRAIYVSRGVGYEGGHAPRIRFLCPPEVSILVLGPR